MSLGVIKEDSKRRGNEKRTNSYTRHRCGKCLAGAIYVGIAGMVIPPLFRRLYRVLTPLSQAQYVRNCARECSALAAAGCGIESMMRGIRGKDDLTNHLVSGSGAGLAYSFVRQGLKLKPAHALSCAAGCAVLSGTECKMNEIFSATSERSTRGKAFDN
ncbi:chloroplastic import inner membrane translocase subunit HP30-1-like [Brassica rapa]|uniref:(rape) hypothetical protein n=1 Tax=Brassica napus TaxID=3708 RepID=A0A816SN98_BRANA|nr:chloroplastic import inner membrane translocase subunit HP30-1-like [Brassica rapa]XP_048637209.1 chloroplastic import inner membrane translocase subunit HP30-1-like [Brassica napus]KAH0923958.1 hypothetical protein HID58_023976 [Brassica napus]CAF2090550.1 unnamed protein product [Brassica napus]